MEATLEDLQRHYSLLSDESLLATDREDLTDTGKICFDAELARRGLKQKVDPPESEAAAESAPVKEDAPSDLVVIGTYEHADEIRIAQGILRSAGILSRRSDEFFLPGTRQTGTVDLLVAADVAEDAVLILESQVSDEELARQAEAAAPIEEEPLEETEDSER
jgi:hypothetical protein